MQALVSKTVKPKEIKADYATAYVKGNKYFDFDIGHEKWVEQHTRVLKALNISQDDPEALITITKHFNRLHKAYAKAIDVFIVKEQTYMEVLQKNILLIAEGKPPRPYEPDGKQQINGSKYPKKVAFHDAGHASAFKNTLDGLIETDDLGETGFDLLLSPMGVHYTYKEKTDHFVFFDWSVVCQTPHIQNTGVSDKPATPEKLYVAPPSGLEGMREVCADLPLENRLEKMWEGYRRSANRFLDHSREEMLSLKDTAPIDKLPMIHQAVKYITNRTTQTTTLIKVLNELVSQNVAYLTLMYLWSKRSLGV